MLYKAINNFHLAIAIPVTEMGQYTVSLYDLY